MDAIHGVKFLNASLCYLNRNILFETVKPYRLIGVDPIETVPLTNLEFGVNADMKIEDFRDVNNDLSLEKNAFKLYEWPSNISPRATPDEIREYCKSMAEIVKEELGAEAVFVYDHRVRKSEGEKNSASRILGNLGERAFELPIDAVHIGESRLTFRKALTASNDTRLLNLPQISQEKVAGGEFEAI